MQVASDVYSILSCDHVFVLSCDTASYIQKPRTRFDPVSFRLFIHLQNKRLHFVYLYFYLPFLRFLLTCLDIHLLNTDLLVYSSTLKHYQCFLFFSLLFFFVCVFALLVFSYEIPDSVVSVSLYLFQEVQYH